MADIHTKRLNIVSIHYLQKKVAIQRLWCSLQQRVRKHLEVQSYTIFFWVVQRYFLKHRRLGFLGCRLLTLLIILALIKVRLHFNNIFSRCFAHAEWTFLSNSFPLNSLFEWSVFSPSAFIMKTYYWFFFAQFKKPHRSEVPLKTQIYIVY